MSTFGDTSIEASAAALAAGALWGRKFTSPSDFGTLTALNVYTDGDASDRTIDLCFYANGAGQPGALLAQTGNFTIVGGSGAGWRRATLTYAGSPSTVYWLMAFNPSGGSSITGIHYAAGGAGANGSWFASGLSTTPPNPVASGSAGTDGLSIYAEYTAAGTFVPKLIGYYVR